MPQPLCAGIGKMLKIRLDGRGAAAKRAGVHVVVAAVVDMAHETGLRPGFQLHEKATDGAVADRTRIAAALAPARGYARSRAACQDGRHDMVLPEIKRSAVEQADAVNGS